MAFALIKFSTVMKLGFSGRKCPGEHILPRRIYINQEEKKMPGHRSMKDRLTLLLCANASGDSKIKPLLVYNSETPEGSENIKNRLGVMWRSNAEAWVTRVLFL
jgi:hypothetical protein